MFVLKCCIVLRLMHIALTAFDIMQLHTKLVTIHSDQVYHSSEYIQINIFHLATIFSSPGSCVENILLSNKSQGCYSGHLISSHWHITKLMPLWKTKRLCS